jgi:peptide/nickel transport system substrate-binding protein
VAPFNDVRVRQALRMIVDRKQMNEVVFLGTGTIANDLWSPYDPVYDRALPQRAPDIEQAKSLLKKAGHANLTIELVTSDIAQGVVQSAQVLAQQASAAGVTINIRQVTVSEFYGPNYLKWPFAQDYWFYLLYFPQVADSMVPGASYNETHYDNPTYFKLYDSALRTTSEAKRKEIATEMQQIDYDSGTYIIPQFVPVIDGHATNLNGVHSSRTGQSLGNYDFKNMWLA